MSFLSSLFFRPHRASFPSSHSLRFVTSSPLYCTTIFVSHSCISPCPRFLAFFPMHTHALFASPHSFLSVPVFPFLFRVTPVLPSMPFPPFLAPFVPVPIVRAVILSPFRRVPSAYLRRTPPSSSSCNHPPLPLSSLPQPLRILPSFPISL
ncbi:hypothetical protein FB451DRAFT_399378 [Mycena latifolia]|nr:hypothetical protein FB451DRAFT_399378 [Mycena latifolia]